MLQSFGSLKPPAPIPRAKPLGPVALLRVLANNPLEAWTEAHFERPVVMGGLPFGRAAVVSDPAAICHVLLDNAKNYQKDWLQRRVLSAGLTDGLLTAEGRQWRVQRRALAPLFARSSVPHFSDAMAVSARSLVERLDRQQGNIVDFAEEATRLTLDVLERTIFSDGIGAHREDIRMAMRRYFDAVGQIDPFDVLGVPAAVPRPRRLKVWPTLRFFESAVDTIIAMRRRRVAEDPNVPRDILTLLLEATDPETGEKLAKSEVRENILTFIAAGHETTANCLTWSLLLLAQSREWRARIQAEADRELNTGDIATIVDRLIETRAVIDEANRLYPPITAISRSATGPDVLAGQPIRRGTMVVIAPYVLHRHRALWDQPDNFDPTRFLHGARDKIERYSYLPFGAGPRVCIGATFALQEASIALATIMRHFEIELASNHIVRPVQKVTLRPQGGLPVVVRRRKLGATDLFV